MKKKLPLLLSLFVLLFRIKAQGVLAPVIYDGSLLAKAIPDTGAAPFTELYYVPLLADSAAQKKLFAKASQIWATWQKNKIAFEDMVLMNENPTYLFDKNGKLNFIDSPENKNKALTSGLPSFRFLADSSKSYLNKRQGVVYYADVNFEKYIQPFYLRKHEVTNAEYREFTDYVRDSLIRTLLANNLDDKFYKTIIDTLVPTLKLIDWNKKIDWQKQEVKEILNELKTPEEDRYYLRRCIDTRKLNYFHQTDINNRLDGHKINVYPDTLCWMNDFSYSYNEPMTNMYFWHPAYNDYPVVGISYKQALAFLSWKEKKMNQQLKAEKKNYRVQLDLPSEIEWEMAENAIAENKQLCSYSSLSVHLNDKSWKCDLQLSSLQITNPSNYIYKTDTLHFEKKPKLPAAGYVSANAIDSLKQGEKTYYLRSGNETVNYKGEDYELYYRKYYFKVNSGDKLYQNTHLTDRYYGNYIIDGFFHTAPANLKKIPGTLKIYDQNKKKISELSTADIVGKQLDVNGISFMGGNVSEWLKEDESAFRSAFAWRLKYLRNLKTRDADLEADVEEYSYRNNAKGGKLVRGANWADERFGNKLGRNYNGNVAKLFINATEKHCTLGFRYVMHLVFVKE